MPRWLSTILGENLQIFLKNWSFPLESTNQKTLQHFPKAKLYVLDRSLNSSRRHFPCVTTEQNKEKTRFGTITLVTGKNPWCFQNSSLLSKKIYK